MAGFGFVGKIGYEWFLWFSIAVADFAAGGSGDGVVFDGRRGFIYGAADAYCGGRGGAGECGDLVVGESLDPDSG